MQNRIGRWVWLAVAMVPMVSGQVLGLARADEEPLPQEHFPAAISRIFLPTVGYDDNDSIQFVIEGTLTDGCMLLDESSVVRTPGTRTLTVTQLAVRRRSPLCDGPESGRPESLRRPVAYSQVVSAGRLEPGQFTLVGDAATREFRVDAASVDSTDNFAYAQVDSVLVPSVVRHGRPAEIVLSGETPAGCVELLEPEVRIIEDVVVVLPKTRLVPGVPCGESEPFLKTVLVDQLRKGRFLAHIRAAGGVSTNQLFTVR